jgi:hypothetical protein
MTKSFLINTSVAAIVSAFVFTAGVSSASARGDNDYGHASQSDGYKGSYGGHYRKHYSHKPHHSYGRYGGSRGYGGHTDDRDHPFRRIATTCSEQSRPAVRRGC